MIFRTNSEQGVSVIVTLPNSSPLKIGQVPKGKDRLPTIHFQGLCFQEGMCGDEWKRRLSWVFVFGLDNHDFLSKLLVVMNMFDGLFWIDFAKGGHEHLIHEYTW